MITTVAKSQNWGKKEKRKKTLVLSSAFWGGGGRINFRLFLAWTIWFGIFNTYKGFLWKKALIRQISRTGFRGSQNMKDGPKWQLSPWQQQGIKTMWTEKGRVGEVGIFNTTEETSRLEELAVSLTHTHVWCE